MLSVITISFIFVTAFMVALLRGIGWAFVAVYIPSLILLNQLPMIPIPHAPMAVQFAPLYAILLAIPFRGESLKFRICSLDIIFFLLLISATITAWSTEVFETGINTLRTDFFTLTAPYLLARIVFKDWQMRRAALYVLIGVLAIISVAAIIEFRFTPYFYLHMLQSAGMGNKIQQMAYERYGFYRVSGPVEHPIYFGNMCVVILGMLAVLARTSGVSLKNPWVAVGLFAASGCIITSISFTPYVGTIASIIFFSTLIFIPITRKLVLPLALLVMLALFAYTYNAATTKLGDKPAGDLPGSQWTRKLIIQECWAKAKDAGPFGYGIRADLADPDSGDTSFDLKSVDNSYMQFTLTHGWVYTALWISIGIFFAFRMTRAFNAIQHPSQVFPLAVATATCLALMVSMYTVWAGALYTVIWVMMLGLGNTLIDQVLEAREQTESGPRQRGFEVVRPITGSSAFRPQPAMRLTNG
jgi:hypothetical protein